MNLANPEERSFLILDDVAVRRHLSMARCIESVRQAMQRVSAGGSELPLRSIMNIPGGPNRLGVMMGYLDDPPSLGVKVVGLYPENPKQGLSSHLGMLLLMDPETGIPSACLDAGAITALRTAAASAVATGALARNDARTLAILGTGEQAEAHIDAITHVRTIERVVIWGRSHDRAVDLAQAWAERLHIPVAAAATVPEAVAEADIVCTTTAAIDPILMGRWLRPGMHLNLVGSSVASSSEVDDGAVLMARFFVDHRASAIVQAGELNRAVASGAVTFDHIVAEIGEVLAGNASGRRSDEEITVYKSLGVAAQDLAAAQAAITSWRHAHGQG